MEMIKKRQKDKINLVLNTIKDNPALSKTEIKTLSGLSMESVLKYIAYLEDKGLIIQCGLGDKADGKIGRRAERYQINAEGCYFIGIKFTSRSVKGVITDFVGDVVASYQHRFSTPIKVSSGLLDGIYQCIDALLKDFDCQKIRAIGIAAPGLVKSSEGVVLRYNDIVTKQSPLNLKGCIEEKYGISTFVENTVKVKSIAYQQNNTKLINHTVYIFIGDGCTSAYIYQDRQYMGCNNFDGELGHIHVPGNTKVCSCGRTGCLETIVGNQYIVKELNELGVTVKDINDFIYHVQNKNRVAIDILAKVSDSLAYTLSLVYTLYNPKKVVLCGDYVMLEDFQSAVKKHLKEYCIEELFESSRIKFIRNENFDSAIDASRLCYYRLFYNKNLV